MKKQKHYIILILAFSIIFLLLAAQKLIKKDTQPKTETESKLIADIYLTNGELLYTTQSNQLFCKGQEDREALFVFPSIQVGWSEKRKQFYYFDRQALYSFDPVACKESKLYEFDSPCKALWAVTDDFILVQWSDTVYTVDLESFVSSPIRLSDEVGNVIGKQKNLVLLALRSNHKTTIVSVLDCTTGRETTVFQEAGGFFAITACINKSTLYYVLSDGRLFSVSNIDSLPGEPQRVKSIRNKVIALENLGDEIVFVSVERTDISNTTRLYRFDPNQNKIVQIKHADVLNYAVPGSCQIAAAEGLVCYALTTEEKVVICKLDAADLN